MNLISQLYCELTPYIHLAMILSNGWLKPTVQLEKETVLLEYVDLKLNVTMNAMMTVVQLHEQFSRKCLKTSGYVSKIDITIIIQLKFYF